MNEEKYEKAWTMFTSLTQEQQDYIVERVRLEREPQEEEWLENLPEERQDELIDAWFEMVREDYIYQTFVLDLSVCGRKNMMELVLDVDEMNEEDEDTNFWIEEYRKYEELN